MLITSKNYKKQIVKSLSTIVASLILVGCNSEQDVAVEAVKTETAPKITKADHI